MVRSVLSGTSEVIRVTSVIVVDSWPNAQNPAGCEVVASPTQIIADLQIGDICSTIFSQKST